MSGQDVLKIVRERWDGMSHWMHEDNCSELLWLAPLVDALRQHPRIGQLFPYTSHHTLCLSRTTRYPFSYDCPRVDAVGHGRFRVSGPKYVIVVRTYKTYRWREAEYEVLGEGGVAQAVVWMDAVLPPGCGSAIDGDLDDLRRSEGKSVTSPTVKALYTSVMMGNEDEVMALLRKGTDVDAADYDGHTPLMKAVSFGKVTMVRLLLAQGANVFTRTPDDETALSLALCSDKYPEIVELLRSAGALE